MNCLAFRRVLLTDPDSTDPGFERHRMECAECASAAARATRMETMLRDAVRVDPPENLASRVLLRQAFDPAGRGETATSGRWRSRPALALAASVVLGLAIMLGISLVGAPGSGLDEEVVALIADAPYALEAKGPVEPVEVLAALRPLGLSVDGALGRVTFASRCYVRGKLAGHIVLRGETGPITVFLMPAEQVARREDFRRPHLSGVLLPTRFGAAAIIGAPGEALGEIEETVRQRVLDRA